MNRADALQALVDIFNREHPGANEAIAESTAAVRGAFRRYMPGAPRAVRFAALGALVDDMLASEILEAGELQSQAVAQVKQLANVLHETASTIERTGQLPVRPRIPDVPAVIKRMGGR
jgi:hypothetical protein